MADEVMAIGLMALMCFTGVALLLNLPQIMLGIDLGLSFSDITGVGNGFWIILLRCIVAPTLTLFSGYVVFNLIKENI